MNFKGYNGTFCELQTNLCLPNPCQNGGTCSNNAGGYVCRCPANYGGVNCQFSTNCVAGQNPCLNGAACVKSFDGSYTCTCTPGFTGLFCSNLFDPCASSPCHNLATCTKFVIFKNSRIKLFINKKQLNNKNGTSFQCTCQGFTGSTCAVDINECLQSPCINNGQCINSYGK